MCLKERNKRTNSSANCTRTWTLILSTVNLASSAQSHEEIYPRQTVEHVWFSSFPPLCNFRVCLLIYFYRVLRVIVEGRVMGYFRSTFFDIFSNLCQHIRRSTFKRQAILYPAVSITELCDRNVQANWRASEQATKQNKKQQQTNQQQSKSKVKPYTKPKLPKAKLNGRLHAQESEIHESDRFCLATMHSLTSQHRSKAKPSTVLRCEPFSRRGSKSTWSRKRY